MNLKNQIDLLKPLGIDDKKNIWEKQIVPFLFNNGFREQEGLFLNGQIVIQRTDFFIVVIFVNEMEYLPYNLFAIKGYLYEKRYYH